MGIPCFAASFIESFFLAAASLAISSGPQIWLCFQVPRAPKLFICSHEIIPDLPKHRKQQISQPQLYTTEMATHQTWQEDKTHTIFLSIVSIFRLLILGMKNNVNLYSLAMKYWQIAVKPGTALPFLS